MFKRRTRKGQAIVEFAMVFPFFLLIVVGGIIDFGFAFYNYQTLQQIANDAAQWGAENIKDITDEAAVANLVEAYAVTLKPTWWNGVYGPPEVTVSDLPTTGGKMINISISYNSPAYTPFYQTMFEAATGNEGIKLSAAASYKRLENLKRY